MRRIAKKWGEWESEVREKLHRPKPPLATSASNPAIHVAKLEEASIPQDLWQAAYNQLEEEEQAILSKIRVPAPPNGEDEDCSQTKAVIDEVIQITKEQYKDYQQGGLKIRRPTGGDINLRQLSRKIISAAWSFKDAISAVAAFDPTSHAASAWAVVLFGLMMTKNVCDLRDAMFKSSEYLADILARCAYIEINFYHNRTEMGPEMRSTIIRVYKIILRYAAEMFNVQMSSMGRRVLNSVTTITNHPLMSLQSSVKEEEQYLYQFVQLDQHLHRKEEAERLLAQTDRLEESVQDVIQKFNLLNLHIAEGAFYDSYLNQHEDICLPDTRMEIRRQITEWAESSESKCIFWLNGMAGTGKSTIARTVAQSFKEKGQLGATFFFKRGEADRANAKRLISTIAQQLVIKHWQLAPGILKAIELDPNISAKSLREQFDKLILQPLETVNLKQTITTVIVIDGLDECEQEDDIKVILNLLPHVQRSSSMRIQIFLTSRPELPIRLGFKQHEDHQDLVLHKIPKQVIEHDIRLFVKDSLLKIRDERSLPSEWPGDDAIEKLTAMAVPLFIFAATVCRFVGKGRQSPERRLARFLQSQAVTSASQMERIYLPVLNQLLTTEDENESTELVKEFLDIVGVIIILATPLSINALAQLLGIQREDIRNVLDVLYSVLRIPDNMDSPVRILHLSFRDFLVNTESSFRVNEKETHRKIALHCLRIMNTSLKHNICGLPSYGTQRTDITSQSVDQCLPAYLQYSCRYWAYHLEQSKARMSSDVLAFLKNHFLHWLEAMGLLGYMPEVVGIIKTLQSIIGENTDSETSEFLLDAKRFVLKNTQIANTAPLQLYCSGLMFSPCRSIIRRQFRKEIPRWIYSVPQMEVWNAELQTLEGHSGYISAVAFSPDGQTVASGSSDNTIKLWDATTGTEQHALKGHSDCVTAVAFSPDGQTLASGSDYGIIILWDAKTGTEYHTLDGHSDSIGTLVFSPDGQTLASGSADGTVKLRDAKTGTEYLTLDCYSDSIGIVTFSPDGQTLASGFDNGIIKLWDAKTGTICHTLKGHFDSAVTVALSPDGQTLTSGSDDGTIELWDAKTGTKYHTLDGHSDSIGTLVFSPDGQTLASGSVDGMIILWSAKTGAEHHKLKAHVDAVGTMAFTPDGQTLASGSDDCTIKLWDTKTSTDNHTLDGHSDLIRTVALSPDGQMLASGSDDHTVKLWDTKTGAEYHTLNGHSDMIQTVAFSPDGQILASGSNDCTVKLWNAKAGTEHLTLNGHLDLVGTVAFSPDGQTLASGSVDGVVKLWDVNNGMEHHTLNGHLYWVQMVAFSPDSQTLASGSGDGTVKLWNAKSGMAHHTFRGHSDAIRAVAFSPDGQTLASGSGDGTVKLWDVKTLTEHHTLRGHSASVRAVAFSPDSQTLASGSDSHTVKLVDTKADTVKLWDVKTGALHWTIPAEGPIKYLSFSNRGPYLYTNFGSLRLQHMGNECPTPYNPTPQAPLANDWVVFDGQKALWLPLEHRKPNCSAIKDGILGLGHRHGRVSIIGFSAQTN